MGGDAPSGEELTFTERYNQVAFWALIAVAPPLLLGWLFRSIAWGHGLGIAVGAAVEVVPAIIWWVNHMRRTGTTAGRSG